MSSLDAASALKALTDSRRLDDDPPEEGAQERLDSRRVSDRAGHAPGRGPRVYRAIHPGARRSGDSGIVELAEVYAGGD